MDFIFLNIFIKHFIIINLNYKNYSKLKNCNVVILYCNVIKIKKITLNQIVFYLNQYTLFNQKGVCKEDALR